MSSTEYIPIRRSNLKYYDKVKLYYKNPYGKIVLYKPAGMKFTDSRLKEKVFIGDLYIKPEDKVVALREVQRGFSMELTEHVLNKSILKVKEELLGLVSETLSEPRSGGLIVVPQTVESIVEGFSSQPDVLKNLVWISHTDYTTAIHSINLMALTIGYCFYCKKSMEDTYTFGLAALLHDVGKTEIPRDILTASRPLTQTEFEIIKKHPGLGGEILQSYGNDIQAAIPGAIEHHEKLDRSGYPKHTGTISEIGQLLSIIDCYEALTNDDRPYRSAMQPLGALEILKSEADSGRFNFDIFKNFAYSLTDFTQKLDWQKYKKLFQGFDLEASKG